MTDHLDPDARSRLMAKIGPKNSKPEMTVRRLAHALGYRFRLHRRDLPGTPDLVFPSRRKAIFVHGCWWHRHADCKKATEPKTRSDFWRAKFDRNVARDRRVEADLKRAGWEVFTVWECQTKDVDVLRAGLTRFLDAEAFSEDAGC